MKPFKSNRAAKTAYTQKKNAWEAKRTEGWEARDTIRNTMRETGSMPKAEYEALEATQNRCESEAKALYEELRAIYTQAVDVQGFYLDTWEFGNNPTRELIRNNMD